MKSLAEKGSARTDATAQLLLLLARDRLPEASHPTALALVAQIEDWQEFFTLSRHNASLPFVYKHLVALKPLGIPAGFLDDMRMLAMSRTISALKLTSAMAAFQRDCIEPVGAQHAYMKGPALAQRFYKDPNTRTCSDIDLIVAEADFGKVAMLAYQKGYRFLLNSEDGTFVSHAQDLSFLIRHADVISMFDQDNFHIELHRYIEKTTPIFPVSRILGDAEPMRLGSTTIQTLSTAWHFVYITYHHSRHFWSRLHWVADLHALMSHPSFDVEEVLKLADEVGLLPTVQAAIELARLTSRPEEWAAILGKTPGGVFLDACLRGLPGDAAFEVESWDAMFLFDFGDQWQFDSKRKFLFWVQSALRRIQPNIYQYIKLRRPRQLEWLYSLENIFILWGNLTKRIAA